MFGTLRQRLLHRAPKNTFTIDILDHNQLTRSCAIEALIRFIYFDKCAIAGNHLDLYSRSLGFPGFLREQLPRGDWSVEHTHCISDFKTEGLNHVEIRSIYCELNSQRLPKIATTAPSNGPIRSCGTSSR